MCLETSANPAYLICVDNTNNRMTYFYGLAFKSFPVAINYFELLTVIVGSYFLGLNASDETLDSFSVSTCIIEQWLLLGMQGHGLKCHCFRCPHSVIFICWWGFETSQAIKLNVKIILMAQWFPPESVILLGQTAEQTLCCLYSVCVMGVSGCS